MSRKTSAFSLVEVVMAMGIAAFALVGLMGLLSASIGSIRDSTHDTMLASMTRTILNDLRRQPFTNLPAAANIGSGAAPQASASTNYFSIDGRQLDSSSGIPSDAVYRCIVRCQGDPATLAPADSTNASGDQLVNLLDVAIEFNWPVRATNSFNGRTIHARVARY